MFRFYPATLILCLCAGAARPQQPGDRWAIQPDGSIAWNIGNGLPHADHIEMSGKKVSYWIQYEVDAAKAPHITRTIVFPTFRLQPNKTASSMMYTVTDAEMPRFFINGRLLKAGIYNGGPEGGLPEQVNYIRHKGIMQVVSDVGKDRSLRLTRTYFPSDDKPLAMEKFVFVNNGQQAATVELETIYRETQPSAERGMNGPLRFVVSAVNGGERRIPPGDSTMFAVSYRALRGDEKPAAVNVLQEEAARSERVNGILALLQLETPDTLLNTAFAFAKIRATESIYLTKGGYMHGPGGLRYYAAIWANDQAEYVNPFFAFLGDSIGIKSAMNAYRLFAKYMNPGYKPIPSSIVAEGDAVWQGAKDRGDMAMIVYGAGRFALTYGHVDSARALWPLIEWCLEYLKRNLNAEGVVRSNSDELEGRFPAGDANLNTSALYYDGLRSAAMLGRLLGMPKVQTDLYTRQADTLSARIDTFFGANIDGFDTYRYYNGNTVLRAWITTPLTVGLFNRKQGTVSALFSPRLWTEDGLATQAGDKTFWDRSTLYGLRGTLAAGETAKAMHFLEYYSRRRLLGEHVPYPVEAYPEGNQRHLSAESGLYCRIYLEGMFGIRAKGFTAFDCTPRLPAGWNSMALKNIHSFAHVFDVNVLRAAKGRLLVLVKSGLTKKRYTIKEGETVQVQL
jgi:hypothetical protein